MSGEDSKPQESNSSSMVHQLGGGLGTVTVTLTSGPAKEQPVNTKATLLVQMLEGIEDSVTDPQWRLLIQQGIQTLEGEGAAAYFQTCIRLTHYPLLEGDREAVIRVVMDISDCLSGDSWHNSVAWLLDAKIGKLELAKMLKESKWRLALCECAHGPGYHVMDPAQARSGSQFVEV